MPTRIPGPRACLRRALSCVLFLALSGCFGGGSGGERGKTGAPSAARPSSPPVCRVLRVSPATGAAATFIDPLITLVYAAPTQGTCRSITLHDAQGQSIPTRHLTATERPNPGGGFVGTVMLEPQDGLAAASSFTLRQEGRTAATFRTGSERRGSLVAVTDLPLALPPLPASAHASADDVNQVRKALALALARGHRFEAKFIEGLLSAEFPHFAKPHARYPVHIAKLSYRSADARGEPVTLSGLLIHPEQLQGGVPLREGTLPVVIGQRGSTGNTDDVPSGGRHILTLPGLIAAAKGHVFIAPDLIGTGDAAALPQAYLIAVDAAAQSQDMLRAVRQHFHQQHGATLGKDLRIVGGSQGGYSAMAALPLLATDMNVRLVSAGDGPYGLLPTFRSTILAVGGAARDAYSVDEDLSFVPGLVRKVMDSLQAYEGFEFDPASVFDKDGALLPSFLRDYRDGKLPAFDEHLAANTLTDVVTPMSLPSTTVRLYHFSDDSLVPEQNTVDLLHSLNDGRHRFAAVERGDCHEHSLFVRTVLRLSKNKLAKHVACVPFQIDAFVAEL